MLEELSLKHLGPIRSAVIAPARGMTAITGETGAGKSMLLSALNLISGGPADPGRVSSGQDEAWAQAVFAVAADGPAEYGSDGPDDSDDGDGSAGKEDAGGGAGAPARRAVAIAAEAGVEPEDGELYLTRTVRAAGRSRAVLNGRTVPKSVLGAVSGELVTIHGQAEQLRLASQARQRELLDHVAGDERQLEAYRAAYRALSELEERLERLRSQEASARQRADYLRESIERINRVDPHPGEDEELRVQRDRIEHAAQITEGVSRALSALDTGQGGYGTDAHGACDLLSEAAHALRAMRLDGEFAQLAERIESLNAELQDVVFALSGHLDEEFGEGDLDRLNARIHELGELTRRWGPELSDVIAWRDGAVFEIEDLDASPEKLAELEAERARLRRAACAAARELSAVRADTASRLAARVGGELASLAMDGASLDIEVSPRVGGEPDDLVLDANGGDDVAFLFTPYEGSPRLPMGTSASGGELSRLMLALELSAAEMRGDGASAGMTFIFDEVDAGVGGKTAVELGRRLARLAQSSQVMVVTHLAQVASWADRQFVVTKEPPDVPDDVPGVVTTIARVDGEDRAREIARMLSGSESEASLDHARELLRESVL